MKSKSHFLLKGSTDDPLVVLRSATWAYNSIGLFDGDQACVVDPGLATSEVHALRQQLMEGCGASNQRQISHVILTHAHHDHMRGWMEFPGATVTFPKVAAEKGATPRERILAAKAKFDERLDDPVDGFRYPEPDLTFDDVLHLKVGDLEVEQRFLPGHSDCTSIVWIPALKTLLSADYLVTPGMPYCRWQARDFERAIETLTTWTLEEGIERIVPAHESILEGRDAILEALAAERDYMRVLRDQVQQLAAVGVDAERGTRQAARFMVGRRGTDLGGRRQDIDNARRVWAEEAESRPS
ncbi:MAG TPA: MBL fold metallo-hydrolase [Planctomycetes bacterium]|nr:MBL fold metallo-hydrolase [Planctomycetota bacterium]HIK61869.1 MBL fold metallo-hydrolase [Planctomycetota bacterium]